MFKLLLLLAILSISLIDSKHHVYKKRASNTWMTHKLPISNRWCECGKASQGKIHDGEIVNVKHFPMMAGLRKRGRDRVVFCGATIISLKQVLTAAHCIQNIHHTYNKRYRRKSYDTVVVTGLNWNIKHKTRPEEQTWEITNLIVHEYYNPNTQDNDIALITVKGMKYFSDTLGPACLPIRQKDNYFINSFVDLLGYGSENFGQAPSKRLQKARVPVVYSRNKYLLFTSGHGKDTCLSDSGGPVLLTTKTINYVNRMFVVGVVSKGSDFCGGGQPGENTRVGAYIDWIYRHTPKGITYCMK